MKSISLISIALALPVSYVAVSQDSAQLEVHGSIPAMCFLDLVPAGGAFDLGPNAPFQNVADVGIWCNDGVGFAKATYEPLSQGGGGPGTNGFYGANTNQYIGYQARLYNGATVITVPMITSITLTQASGTGPSGVFNYSQMEMKATTDGSEMADSYTAMIQITVDPF